MTSEQSDIHWNICTPQVDREDADITSWDTDCPDMSEHNSRDCAALISITVKEEEKQLAARYRDLPCMVPVEEIQVQHKCLLQYLIHKVFSV